MLLLTYYRGKVYSGSAFVIVAMEDDREVCAVWGGWKKGTERMMNTSHTITGTPHRVRFYTCQLCQLT